MPEVTEAFDEWLEIVRFHHGQSNTGIEIVTNPGVSDDVIAEAEHELGFSLAPEARDLYQHANGLNRPVTIFPRSIGFYPLKQALPETRVSTGWINDQLSLIHI